MYTNIKQIFRVSPSNIALIKKSYMARTKNRKCLTVTRDIASQHTYRHFDIV